MRTVVCVDDAEEELQALEYQFASHYQVVPCRDAASALSVVSKTRPAAVLLDLEMPGYNGFRVLSDLRKLDCSPPVIMLSGHAEPLFIVRALREGAADFIAKPYNFSMLRRRLDMLVDAADQQSDGPMQAGRRTKEPDGLLLGRSGAINRLREEIQCFASVDLPVLIQGESGTGKDLAARAVHDASRRAYGPYHALNIGAIPPGLAESELFGCEKGAFTDARPRKGCFELADEGTLFLDEIGDANYAMQTALLRIVEDRLVRRLGGTTYRQVDCRLVCATNKDLEYLAARNEFRHDLKYRIDGLTLRMPPLRDHREDIPELAEWFLKRLDQQGCPTAGIDTGALDKLAEYAWPGNVRQLRTCIERAALLAQGTPVQADHIRF